MLKYFDARLLDNAKFPKNLNHSHQDMNPDPSVVDGGWELQQAAKPQILQSKLQMCLLRLREARFTPAQLSTTRHCYTRTFKQQTGKTVRSNCIAFY